MGFGWVGGGFGYELEVGWGMISMWVGGWPAGAQRPVRGKPKSQKQSNVESKAKPKAKAKANSSTKSKAKLRQKQSKAEAKANLIKFIVCMKNAGIVTPMIHLLIFLLF